MTLRHITYLLTILTLLLTPSIPTQSIGNGSYLLKDINTHPSDGSKLCCFMPFDERVFFFADAGWAPGRTGLWITDGTDAGTQFLAKVFISTVPDANPVTVYGTPPPFYAVWNGILYFTGSDGTHGYELWRSDGTGDGTYMLADMTTGTDPGVTYSSGPGGMATLGNWLVMVTGQGLARSDGTTEGTQIFWNGVITSRLVAYNGALYFGVYDIAMKEIQLWRTDATSAGTQQVLSFGSGGSNYSPRLQPLIAYNNVLYVMTTAGTSALWRTDGTPAGTQMVVSPASSDVDTYLVYNQRLYFIGTDSTHGSELWVTDGTDAGTQLFLDACPGTCSGGFIPAGIMDELLCFITRSESGLHILWRTDGTITGTNQLVTLPPLKLEQVQSKPVVSGYPAAGMTTGMSGEWDNNPNLILWHGALYFSSLDGSLGSELWRSDGTPSGTVVLQNFNSDPRNGEPTNFTPCGARLCFTADDGAHGNELWSTSGTIEDTALLVDVNNAPANSYPGNFISAGRWVYFEASDGDNGESLWRTDGFPGGVTERVIADAVFYLGDPAFYGVMNGVLYLRAYDLQHGMEIWRVGDDGARMVRDLIPGTNGSFPAYFATVQDRLFFLALTPESITDFALWVTDGTAAGTQVVHAPSSGTSIYYQMGNNFIVHQGLLLFFVQNIPSGACDLWHTDGTPGGTQAVTTVIGPGPGISTGSRVYFTTRTANGYISLIVTDLTQTGTHPVTFPDGTAPFLSMVPLTASGNTLFFLINDGFTSTISLWKIPEAGNPIPVKNIPWEGSLAYYGNGLIPLGNNQVAFALIINRQESLWVSDGTENGTFPLSGSFGQPMWPFSVGSTLFFIAQDSNTTRLWRYAYGGKPIPVTGADLNLCRPIYPPLGYATGQMIFSAMETTPNGHGCEPWAYDFLPYRAYLVRVGR